MMTSVRLTPPFLLSSITSGAGCQRQILTSKYHSLAVLSPTLAVHSELQ